MVETTLSEIGPVHSLLAFARNGNGCVGSTVGAGGSLSHCGHRKAPRSARLAARGGGLRGSRASGPRRRPAASARRDRDRDLARPRSIGALGRARRGDPAGRVHRRNRAGAIAWRAARLPLLRSDPLRAGGPLHAGPQCRPVRVRGRDRRLRLRAGPRRLGERAKRGRAGGGRPGHPRGGCHRVCLDAARPQPDVHERPAHRAKGGRSGRQPRPPGRDGGARVRARGHARRAGDAHGAARTRQAGSPPVHEPRVRTVRRDAAEGPRVAAEPERAPDDRRHQHAAPRSRTPRSRSRGSRTSSCRRSGRSPTRSRSGPRRRPWSCPVTA